MNILKHDGQKSSKTSLIKECNVLQMGHKNILHSIASSKVHYQ